MSDLAQFEIMRFQIMAFALSEVGQNKISDAYLYAWYNKILPCLDDGADSHEPFEAHFKVSAEQLNELVAYLDDAWLKKAVPTFYELEKHYDIRQGGSDWSRGKLIQACRYIHLSESFDKAFWERLLAPTEHLTEAQAITRELDREQDIHFN